MLAILFAVGCWLGAAIVVFSGAYLFGWLVTGAAWLLVRVTNWLSGE